MTLVTFVTYNLEASFPVLGTTGILAVLVVFQL